MMRLQRTGYRSANIAGDITLGLVFGLGLSLWAYVYAAIVYIGPLTVYLPVGILQMLLGWVLASTWVILVSREPLHITTMDDQAVVIFGSVSAMLVLALGDTAGTPRGLATLLVVIAGTNLLFAACCYAVGRFQLSRVLETIPYPVICGFMASVGWLLLVAAFEVVAETTVGLEMFEELRVGNHAVQLFVSAALGAGLLWLSRHSRRAWALPAASLAIVLVFHAVMALAGLGHEQQVAHGWLFDVPKSEGGALAMLGTLSPGDIDWPFVLRAVPLMLTVILIAMLYFSLVVTGFKAFSREKLQISEEFKALSTGNLLGAAVAGPPVYTDLASAVMYRKIGASSRWFVLSSCAVGLAIALFGGGIIGYLPKILMGANIFLFAFWMLYDWLYANVRSLARSEYLIILVILGFTMTVGFMAGIGAGLVLAVLLFVVRYSHISAIHSRSTLREERSSVERSKLASEVLDREGDRVSIYHLRGFLFFGSANAILEAISGEEGLAGGGCEAVLLDFRRVTGVDASALIALAEARNTCHGAGAILVYAHVEPEVAENLASFGAIQEVDGRPLLFDDDDFAMEYLEDRLLKQHGVESGVRSIRDYLSEVIDDAHKVELLLRALDSRTLAAGETLFSCGDPDDGLYIVESGYLSAMIDTSAGERLRVKKFSPGSLLGELSGYLDEHSRTATVVADTAAVVYHLDVDALERTDQDRGELRACVHELVATTLAARVSYMNRRLLSESG